MHPILQRVTKEVIERSHRTREAYLERVKTASSQTPHRTVLGCGNLAHGFAACSSHEKADMATGQKPNIAIISSYNDMQMNPGPDWRMLLVKRATVTGFIVSDHFGQMEGFWKEVPALVKAGRLKYREDIVQGLDQAPEAFIGLLKGRNFGKLLVQVSDDPTRR